MQDFFKDAPMAEPIDLIKYDGPLPECLLESEQCPPALRQMKMLLDNTGNVDLIKNKIKNKSQPK